MEAIADFGERRAGDLQEMQAISLSMAAVSFNNVHWNGERGPAELRGESEPFDDWKLKRQTVCANIQIVRALPRYEGVVGK